MVTWTSPHHTYSVSVQLFTWQTPTCCAEDPVWRASLLCLHPSRHPVSRVGVSLNQIRGRQIEMHDVSSATPGRDKPPHPREAEVSHRGQGPASPDPPHPPTSDTHTDIEMHVHTLNRPPPVVLISQDYL